MHGGRKTPEYLSMLCVFCCVVVSIALLNIQQVAAQDTQAENSSFLARFQQEAARLKKRLQEKNQNYPDLWTVRECAKSFEKPSPSDLKALRKLLITSAPHVRPNIEAELAVFIVVRTLPRDAAAEFFKEVAAERKEFLDYTSWGMMLVDHQLALRLFLDHVKNEEPSLRDSWYDYCADVVAICGTEDDLAELDNLVPDYKGRFDFAEFQRYRAGLSRENQRLLEEQEAILFVDSHGPLWSADSHLSPCNFAADRAFFLCRHNKFSPHLLRDRLHDPLTLWVLFYQEKENCRATINEMLRELKAGTFKRKSPFGQETGCDLADHCQGILNCLDQKKGPFDEP